MAFELKDFFRQYVRRGNEGGVFNISREDPTDGLEFYAYQNECGSYVFQRITTSGTLRIYEYYARGSKATTFATDWTDRANKTYVEFYALFNQND